MKKEASSPWVSASPSMLVVMSAVVRSSVGCSRRWAASSFIRSVSSWPALRKAITASVPSGMYSGSPFERITLEQRNTVAYSEGGTPIMSQMISRGSGAAISVTKSHSPRPATRSITRSATASMVSSMLATRRGLNAAETIRRRRAWRGLSVEIMPAKYSTISGGRSRMLTAPFPEV